MNYGAIVVLITIPDRVKFAAIHLGVPCFDASFLVDQERSSSQEKLRHRDCFK